MCSVTSAVPCITMHWSGNGIAVAWVFSVAILYQVLHRSSVRWLSHFNSSCHSCWRNRLVVMVTGVISLITSKILEVHFRNSQFHSVFLNIATSRLGIAHIVSDWLSHHKPSTLTRLLISAILCVCAILFNHSLLEAQECKLKLVLHKQI